MTKKIKHRRLNVVFLSLKKKTIFLYKKKIYIEKIVASGIVKKDILKKNVL